MRILRKRIVGLILLALGLNSMDSVAQSSGCKGRVDNEPVFGHPTNAPVAEDGGYFGVRTHPLLRTPQFHTGLDYSGTTDQEVHAAESGTVISAGRHATFGNMVRIEHGRGDWETTYGHLARFSVKPGDCVQKGEIIGQIGATGMTARQQLHFEIRRYVDPMTLLPPREK